MRFRAVSQQIKTGFNETLWKDSIMRGDAHIVFPVQIGPFHSELLSLSGYAVSIDSKLRFRGVSQQLMTGF